MKFIILEPSAAPLIAEIALVSIRRKLFEKAAKDLAKILKQRLEDQFCDEKSYKTESEIEFRHSTSSISFLINPNPELVSEERWNEHEMKRIGIKMTSGKGKAIVSLYLFFSSCYDFRSDFDRNRGRKNRPLILRLVITLKIFEF